MSDETGIAAAVEAGLNAAHANERIADVEGVPVAFLPRGMSATVLGDALEQADKYRGAPRRLRGTSTHFDLVSFVSHVNRFKLPTSTIWARSEGHCRVTAIYNYNPSPDAAGWGDHRATYSCPFTPQWVVWSGTESMGQTKLAERLEDNFEDLVSSGEKSSPAPTDILEMARNLQINSKGTFQRKIDRATGEYSMVCKQEHDSNSTKIPRSFCVGIPVFQGGPTYLCEIRLRFAIREGRPEFELSMHRADEVLEDAFREILDKVADSTKLPLYNGIAE